MALNMIDLVYPFIWDFIIKTLLKGIDKGLKN